MLMFTVKNNWGVWENMIDFLIAWCVFVYYALIVLKFGLQANSIDKPGDFACLLGTCKSSLTHPKRIHIQVSSAHVATDKNRSIY